MSKNKKKKNLTNKVNKQIQDKSVTSIVSEDKNKISDASTEAMKTIDSVAYADNLVGPDENSKSIRSLNIADNECESTPIKEENVEDLKEELKEIEKKPEEKKLQVKENNGEKADIKEKKSHKKLFVFSFCILAIIILFLLFSTIFALITSGQTAIIHGIKIKDIDVSGLSKEEAIEKVSIAFQEKLEKQITLKHNEYEITVFPGQFDVSFAIEEAVDMAYEKGRARKYFSKQL